MVDIRKIKYRVHMVLSLRDRELFRLNTDEVICVVAIFIESWAVMRRAAL